MGRLKHWVGAPPSEWGHDAHSIDAGYDLAGNMTSIVYPDNALSIVQSFDAAGRLSGVTDAATGKSYVSSISYMPSGSPDTIVYGNGVTEHLKLNNRLQPCEHNAFSPVAIGGTMVMDKRYFYSPASEPNCGNATANNGNIFHIADCTNPNYQSTRYSQDFTYDPLNRLRMFDVQTMGGQHRHQEFAYDSFGNILSMASTAPLPGGPDPLSFSATYQPGNNRMNPSSFNCLPLSAGVTPQGVPGQVDVYDAAGNVGCSGNQGTDAKGYTWDPESRLAELWTQQQNNTYIQAAIYTYDANGNRIRSDQMAPSGPNGQSQSQSFKEYSYFNGQVLAEKDQNDVWTDYIYANGKKIAKVGGYENRIRTSATATGNPSTLSWNLSAPTRADGSAYAVTLGDQLCFRQFSGNAYGGPVVSFLDGNVAGQSTLGWTASDQQPLNHLTTQWQWLHRCIDLSGSGQSVGSHVTISVLRDWPTPNGYGDLWYADMSVTSPDGTVTQVMGDSAAFGSGQTFTGDYANSGPVAVQENFPATGVDSVEPTRYYLADQLGTTQLEFGTGGYPLWRGEFAPFGQELDTQTTTNHYKFTGKERDTESGLDYFGARYYASSMGRWMSPDWSAKASPVPYAKLDNPQSLNLYAYVFNNPMTHWDADGHIIDDASLKDNKDYQKWKTNYLKRKGAQGQWDALNNNKDLTVHVGWDSKSNTSVTNGYVWNATGILTSVNVTLGKGTGNTSNQMSADSGYIHGSTLNNDGAMRQAYVIAHEFAHVEYADTQVGGASIHNDQLMGQRIREMYKQFGPTQFGSQPGVQDMNQRLQQDHYDHEKGADQRAWEVIGSPK